MVFGVQIRQYKYVHGIAPIRSSHRRYSAKKSVSKIFADFTGKCLCWSLFLIKFQIFRPSDLKLYQNKTPTQVFFSEIYEVFQNTYVEKYLRTTASASKSVDTVNHLWLGFRQSDAYDGGKSLVAAMHPHFSYWVTRFCRIYNSSFVFMPEQSGFFVIRLSAFPQNFAMYK